MTKTITLFLLYFLTSFQTTGILNGKWKLVQYKDLINGTIKNEPTEYNNQKVMTFDFNDDNIQGVFTGKTINNDTQGSYILKANSKIVVSTFGGTKVAEPNWSSRFWETIQQSTSYKVTDDTLIIYYNNDKKCMIFVKQR